jgi:uncharacterized protein YqhQ
MTTYTKTREQEKAEQPEKATVKAWLGLGVLGLTSLVVAMDLFVLLQALSKKGIISIGNNFIQATVPLNGLVADQMIEGRGIYDVSQYHRSRIVRSRPGQMCDILSGYARTSGNR